MSNVDVIKTGSFDAPSCNKKFAKPSPTTKEEKINKNFISVNDCIITASKIVDFPNTGYIKLTNKKTAATKNVP